MSGPTTWDDLDDLLAEVAAIDRRRQLLQQQLIERVRLKAEGLRPAPADAQQEFIERWRWIGKEHRVAGLGKAAAVSVRDPHPAAAVDVDVNRWPYPLRAVARSSEPSWIMVNGATFPPSSDGGANHLMKHRLAARDGSWACRYCNVHLSCGCDPADHLSVADVIHPGELLVGIAAEDLFVRGDIAEADHVIPKTRGGSDHDHNRVLTCGSCNASKRDLTPDEWFAALRARGEVVDLDRTGQA